jgi:hypothetical protein
MNAILMLAAMFSLVPAIGPTEGSDIVSRGGLIRATALTWTGATCSAWRPKQSIGSGFYAGYCANRRTVNGISYEVQRDDFYYYNGTVPIVTLKSLLDCSADPMPSEARSQYCR